MDRSRLVRAHLLRAGHWEALALLAWLAPLVCVHLWSRGLVEGHHHWGVALVVAVSATVVAMTLELRFGGRSDRRTGKRALVALALFAGATLYPVLRHAWPWHLLALAPLLAVMSCCQAEGRARLATLVLGVAIGYLGTEKLHFGFGCVDPEPWPARVARHWLGDHELLLGALAVAALAFASALGDRRRRPLAMAGVVLTLGAAALELLGAAAARQVRWASRTGGARPFDWRVDELATAADVVEWLTLAALAFLLAAWLFREVLRHRGSVDSARPAGSTLASGLVLAGVLVWAAQSPIRVPITTQVAPVDLAFAPGWDLRRNDPWIVGTHAVLVEADGNAESYLGRRPLARLRFHPLARVVVYADRRARAFHLRDALRTILARTSEVLIAVESSPAPGVSTPSAAARGRWPFAAGLSRSEGSLRAVRGDHAQPDVEPCPTPRADESVGQWLARRPPNCALSVRQTHARRSNAATETAPLGDIPRFRERLGRSDAPAVAAVLAGLGLALLLFVGQVDRALGVLATLGARHRSPVPAPGRRGPIHPPWLAPREATHWWPLEQMPYRDQRGFRGPAGRGAALKALGRRLAHALGRVARRALLHGLALVALAWLLLELR